MKTDTMKHKLFLIIFFITASCLLLNSSVSAGQKVDAVSGPSPKVVPYVTEQRYFFSQAGFQQGLQNTVERVMPAVVSIGTLKSQEGKVIFKSSGSGVVIDPQGYILTTYQTVKEDLSPKVTVFAFNHRHQFDSQVISLDKGSNLALIKVLSPYMLPAAYVGTGPINPGDWLVSFGSSNGLDQKVVPGVVSATGRSIKMEGVKYTNLIKANIKIEPACVGGPVTDIHGGVIGIYFDKGLIIPIHQAAPLLASIYPRVPIQEQPLLGNQVAAQKTSFFSFLGIEVIPVNKIIARQLDVHKRGVLVNRLVVGSPAERAGVFRGDVITRLNRRKIKDGRALSRLLKTIKPGDTVKLDIIRGGQKQTLNVVLGRKPRNIHMPHAKPIARRVDWMDMEISNLTQELVNRFGISPDSHGVVIISVPDMLQPSGIQRGDLIRKVNGMPVGEVGRFLAVVGKNKKHGFLFDILRQGEPIYITLR